MAYQSMPVWFAQYVLIEQKYVPIIALGTPDNLSI